VRVAVLAGGRSSEHDVSLASAESVRAGLVEGGHSVVDVRLERDGLWTLDGSALSLTPGTGLRDADAVFPVLHGPFGEDGTVQGLLELLDVPYVGAGVLASSVSMDKVISKDLMAAHGVPQVDYAALRDGASQQEDLGRLGLPVFVKPARLGSSVGISRATTADELTAAVSEAFRFDSIVIVEALGSGLEVECSVIGDQVIEASEPGEIVLTGAGEGGWYDYEAKYTPGGMELMVPARISDVARKCVQTLAIEVFRLVGGSGMARVDFFVDGDEVLVNELNTIPGFTSTSVYAKLFDASGVPYPTLLDRLLQLAVERHERERRYRH
jgi:D-alanine-D-alanine ligase